jgi:DNA-binding LacI/PurR family transcriptional regulator
MATLKQVAEAAGVSVKTVSRVINEEPEVAADTRQHILQIIQALNYHPNMRARALVRSKTGAVAVVNPTAGAAHLDLFFDSALRGIAQVLSDHRLDLLLYLSHELPYCELYLQKRVDGMILMNLPYDDPNLRGLDESGAPCVFTCYLSEDDRAHFVVDADYSGGTAQAVAHLVALGHRRIALLPGPADLISVRLRVRGYRQALAQHGLVAREDYIAYSPFYEFDVTQQAVNALLRLDHPPTALICGEDMMAINVITALHRLGLRVPDDLSVVGFDDVVLAQHVTPALTTLRQDGYRKGTLAAEMLVALMTGTLAGPSRQTTLAVDLVQRSSTARCTADYLSENLHL